MENLEKYKNVFIESFQIKKNQLKNIRKDIQIVFQDPFSSLSPRMNVYEILSEGIDCLLYTSPSPRD